MTRGSLILVNARVGLFANAVTPTFPTTTIDAFYYVDVEFVAAPPTPTPAPATPSPTPRPTPAPATPSPTPRPTPSPVPGSTPSPTPRPTPSPVPGSTPSPTPESSPSPTSSTGSSETHGTASGPSTVSTTMTSGDGGLIEIAAGTSSGLLSSPTGAAGGTDNSVLIPAIVAPIAVVALLAAIGVAVFLAKKKSKTQGSSGDHATGVSLQPHYGPSPVADSGTIVGNYGPSPLTESSHGAYDRVAAISSSNSTYDAPPAVARYAGE
jgi:hypothetical protein